MKLTGKLKFAVVLCIFIVAVTASSVYTQDQRTDVFQLEDRVSKTYPLKSGGYFFLENIVGDIKIKTWNKEEVKIEIELIGRYRNGIEIEIYHDLNEIEVTTNYEDEDDIFRSRRRRHSVEYEVYIPADTRLEVKGITSDIEIEGLNNELEANTTTGDVIVKNIKGDIDVRTITGSIEITKVIGQIDCNVVTGDINIEDSEFSYLEAGNTTGEIEVEAKKVDVNSRYNLKTVTGDILLFLPQDVKADINASVPEKNLHSDFILESRYGKYDRKDEDDDRNRSRKRRDRDFDIDIKINLDFLPKKIDGKINGGGARIYLSTFNGDIELRKF